MATWTLKECSDKYFNKNWFGGSRWGTVGRVVASSPEDRGSYPANEIFVKNIWFFLKDQNRDKEAENGPLLKQYNFVLVLNVTANNATCQLYNRFATSRKATTRRTDNSIDATFPPRIFFVHVDVEMLFGTTSIATLHKNGLLKSGDSERHPIVHYRWKLLHKNNLKVTKMHTGNTAQIIGRTCLSATTQIIE